MKKTIMMILLCAVMVTVSACGKENANEAENLNKADTVLDTEDTDQVDLSMNTEGALLGVYEGASDYLEIPMGTFFEGEQKDFCKIKMPSEYIMSALYSTDGENGETNLDVYGIPVKDYDFSNTEYANKEIVLKSTGGSTLWFYIIPTSVYTMEEEKEYAGEYKELSSKDHEVIYFVDQGEYATADLTMDYQINDNIILTITYEGPLADSLGLDQLAQNIYNLVTVIE